MQCFQQTRIGCDWQVHNGALNDAAVFARVVIGDSCNTKMPLEMLFFMWVRSNTTANTIPWVTRRVGKNSATKLQLFAYQLSK
jgi:hypothetical protein